MSKYDTYYTNVTRLPSRIAIMAHGAGLVWAEVAAIAAVAIWFTSRGFTPDEMVHQGSSPVDETLYCPLLVWRRASVGDGALDTRNRRVPARQHTNRRENACPQYVEAASHTKHCRSRLVLTGPLQSDGPTSTHNQACYGKTGADVLTA